MKEVYPVILTQVEGCCLVEVPDLEIVTEGKNLADAINMARDAISLKCVFLEDEGQPVPPPSPMAQIDVPKGAFADDGRGVVSLVDIDTLEYRREIDNKAVRRNVTLPNWLDSAAKKAKVNVSRILQEALIKELGLTQHA